MNYLIEKYLAEVQYEHPEDLGVKILYQHLKSYREFVFTEFADLANLSYNQTVIPSSVPSVTRIEQKYRNYADYRLKSFVFANFKKFNKGIDDKPYGLTLSNAESKKNPFSVFLVGKNGVGKSSIYSALEYVYTPERQSAMKMRDIDMREISWFLPHASKRQNDMVLRASIVGNDKPLRIIRGNFSLQPFFCSELDIDDLSKRGDYTSLVKEELGFAEVDKLVKALKKSLAELDKQIGSVKSSAPAPAYWTLDTLQSDVMYIASRGARWYPESDQNYYIIMRAIINLLDVDFDDLFALHKCLREKMPLIFTVQKAFKLPLAILVENEALLRTLEEISRSENIMETPRSLFRLLEVKDRARKFFEEAKTYMARLEELMLKEKQGVPGTSILEIGVSRINQLNEEKIKRKLELLTTQEAESQVVQNSIRIKELLEFLLREIEVKYQADYSRVCDELQTFIPEVVNSFSVVDNSNPDNIDTLSLECKNGEINMFIENKYVLGAGKRKSPRYYYNSFRLKMFCLTLKIALSLQTMRMMKINAPFIFDDVFQASDFDNTIQLHHFWKYFFESFKKVTGKKLSELQIIMFTHDEVALNSVVRSCESCGGKEFIAKTGRLYAPEMLEESDYDKEGNFYNLYQII